MLCGHVVGLQQTAFRAELCAIVHALAIAEALDCQVRIWSDCQSALLVARRFQRGLARVRANGSHADLWTLVQDRLQPGGHRVVFMQVFSHNEVSSGMDAVEQWAYWHNGLTDTAAGNFCRNVPTIFGRLGDLQSRIGSKSTFLGLGCSCSC